MKNLNFGVYQHDLTTLKGTFITRYFIVLKVNNRIYRFTNFSNYAITYEQNDKDVQCIQSSDKNMYWIIAKFLNYCFFEKQYIKSLDSLTLEMVQNFFYDYSFPNNREPLEKDTVKRTLKYIMSFLENLSKEKIINFKKDDIYQIKEVYSYKFHTYNDVKKPKFIVYFSNKKKDIIYRDMPIRAFQIIVKRASSHHIRILMLIALCAYAGLRPSEALNVVMENSPLGPGIIFDFINGRVASITIDISEERAIRSDLKSVGKIKRERFVNVYSKYVSYLYEIYKYYLTATKNNKRDARYMALTVDRNGNAMTYDTYRKEFNKLITECIPLFLGSNDPKTVHFGQMLLKKKIAPHIFRHYFTMSLVLNGCNVHEIMAYRGDGSPESAQTYIAHKSEIEQKYREVKSGLFNFMLEKAERLYGNAQL